MVRIFWMGAFVALFAFVGCNRSSEPRGHAATQGDERPHAKRSRDMQDGAKAKPGRWDEDYERDRARRRHDDNKPRMNDPDYRDGAREDSGALRHDIKEQSRETGQDVKEESRTTIESAKSKTSDGLENVQRRLDD